MHHANRNNLRPNKLLNSKWTAVTPVNKEKHFLVVKLCATATPDEPVTHVELEAVHSGRVQILPWRALQDAARWHQGWKT
ncbi:MAG: TIGR02450 family Trp-rich protein [Janthinobacterium sp.]|uniref:TIGR02450 family Trp-rich protein n=1 Tax=Janthinobacterium sp. FT68W TaxID=2654255 RepID=UPI001264F2A4|nr:TIGR02450 family Trp-rich protein [Janthinobacterium sp. FT68W]KAB8051698.1 TIGR02450 family Trp-rich protein [Janthinobacterium sp. FT68W]